MFDYDEFEMSDEERGAVETFHEKWGHDPFNINGLISFSRRMDTAFGLTMQIQRIEGSERYHGWLIEIRSDISSQQREIEKLEEELAVFRFRLDRSGGNDRAIQKQIECLARTIDSRKRTIEQLEKAKAKAETDVKKLKEKHEKVEKELEQHKEDLGALARMGLFERETEFRKLRR